MTANERRSAIIKALCVRRFETVSNLAFEFNVSGRTIRNDIVILSLEYPIYTTQGNGGGIHVEENYKLGTPTLNGEEQQLLQRLLPTLNGKDEQIMKSILQKFGFKGDRKCGERDANMR